MADALSVCFNFEPTSPNIKSNLELDRHIRNHVNAVSHIPSSAFLKNIDTPQDFLEILNPSVNSIPYAFALFHRTQTHDWPKGPKSVPDTFRPGGASWGKLVEFLDSFDPVQMRYIGDVWRRLVEYCDRVARVMGTPGMAISPVRSAMLQLDPSTGTFTSNHLQFMRTCLEAGSYTAALPILDSYIYNLPQNIAKALIEIEGSVPCAETSTSSDFITTRSGHSEKITLSDLHEYYMLGAIAYIGARKFKQALLFLEHILITPTANIANGIMWEAYKKWVILGCLVNGVPSAIPRTANSNAMKQIRTASKAYDALTEAFQAQGSKLRAQAEVGVQTWAEDGNTGLVSELVDHQMRLAVSKLKDTYSAIPLTHVAKFLGFSMQEAEAYVRTLVARGYLNASLDHTPGPNGTLVLRFYTDLTEGPLAKSEKEQHLELLQQTARTNKLAEQVKAADYRLTLNKDYLEHVRRLNKKAAANAASGDAMDVTWDEQEPEEDIMGDLIM
ncbi:hypothetical protein BU16DRAFT_378766 [Lophium mytilinum]|uniref:COP9 signalosome complex subunit 3 n=1 Tax=Lophium mytilinum TaxID=390894 RepID=A0A6A6QSV7_9PEZI|nr:hypothetical protein BU16DRAFT_378766 [Lophium mytilinum]